MYATMMMIVFISIMVIMYVLNILIFVFAKSDTVEDGIDKLVENTAMSEMFETIIDEENDSFDRAGAFVFFELLYTGLILIIAGIAALVWPIALLLIVAAVFFEVKKNRKKKKKA